MKYIPCKKKDIKPVQGRIVNKTYGWVVRDPNYDGNIKIMCNNCYTHFPVNNSEEVAKYNYCPSCGIKLDKDFAEKQLDSSEIKKRIELKRLKESIENWPQWKKDLAEAINKPYTGYEPLDFP